MERFDGTVCRRHRVMAARRATSAWTHDGFGASGARDNETSQLHSIEINDRRVRGPNEIAYLTANYETTFSSERDPTPRRSLGSRLWILRKRAGTWVVALVGWSVWGGGSSDRKRIGHADHRVVILLVALVLAPILLIRFRKKWVASFNLPVTNRIHRSVCRLASRFWNPDPWVGNRVRSTGRQ